MQVRALARRLLARACSSHVRMCRSCCLSSVIVDVLDWYAGVPDLRLSWSSDEACCLGQQQQFPLVGAVATGVCVLQILCAAKHVK
jgi:hypothetical protein